MALYAFHDLTLEVNAQEATAGKTLLESLRSCHGSAPRTW